jgi:hypothetical protein
MGFLFFQNHKKVCVFFLLGIVSDAQSQRNNTLHFIDPYTLNVVGNAHQFNNLKLDWSVGEVAIFKLADWQKQFILSSGFLQSNYTPLALYQQIDSFALQIKVGPNPFSNRIIIQSKVDGIIITSIQLHDFNGAILYSSMEYFSGIQFYKEIIVDKLMIPICFLEIKYTISDHIYKSKYIKLIQH